MRTGLSFLVLGVVVATGARIWPASGSVVRAAQNSSGAPVQMVPAGQRQAGNPGEKGATYYGIEAQTARLTTTFRDGSVAIAERGLAGDVRTTVRGADGNERAQLRIVPIDGEHTSIRYEPQSGSPFQTLSNPAVVKHTLDWATRQAYGLVQDGTDNLVWDNGTIRPRAAAPRTLDGDVDQIETVWANGIVARLTRHDFPPREIAKGRVVQGAAWVTDLFANGVSAGHSIWFERDQVFAYYLPGLTTGITWIGPEHLKGQYGGWPFKPDMTWLNLQTIAVHHFTTLQTRQGFVAKGCQPEGSLLNRVAQFFVPTVSANEPGCDGLHWLDGTMIRGCCDDHDRCYSRSGCTSQSWWRVWTSWSCDFCNMAVVACFAAGELGDPCRDRSWWGC